MKELLQKKQAKKEEDDRILRQIVEETERKRKEEEEFNALRDLLWEEELEAKRSADVAERRNKQIRMRDEMLAANAEMMKFKQVQRLKDAENEARLVSLMRQKFAQDEAKERAEEEERRRQKAHHMSLIERQKDERKYLYEKEREEEARLMKEAQDREEYRKQVIQEARKRLLEEHASRLRGFLPNKVFDSREEYEQFRNASTPY
jgi:colicin import membrane protein